MARVSVSRLIAAPQRDVWAVLTDIPNARRWNKSWTAIELTSTQQHGIGMTFRAQTEGDDAFDFEVCEWSAPDRIAFCPIRHPLEPQYSIMLDAHEFALEPGPSENETIVTLSAKATARGMRGIFIASFFWRGHQKQGLEAALDNVASVFETSAPDPEQADGLPALEE